MSYFSITFAAVFAQPLQVASEHTAMEEQKQQIINKSLEQFKQYGIKSVSIDDICREMGMSKKTFYVYFPGKEELIVEVLNKLNDNAECNAAKYMSGKSTLECIRHIMNMHEKVGDVHKEPPMVYDLKKYYPKLYKDHIRNVHKLTKRILIAHLQRGIEEGVYRSDLDVEMCATMFALIQQSFMRNEDELRTISPRRVVQFTMESFMRSIVSDEGGHLIRQTMNNNNKNNKVQK